MSAQSVEFGNRPVDQLKMTELREELKRRKISTGGLKADLVRRLEEALRNEAEENMAQQSDSDASDTKESDIVQKYHSENHKSNEDFVIDEKNQNPSEQNLDIDFKRTENSDHKEDQNIPNPVMELSSPKPEEPKPEIVVDDAPGSCSKDSDAEPLECSLNQVVSEKVSPVVGFQVKCESVSTDSVSILEENELKDSLNADNNVNVESSEVVVKRRNSLQQESSRYPEPPQQSSGDIGSDLVEQRVGLSLVEERRVSNDVGSNCKLDGDSSRMVEQQDIPQNEDSLDFKHGPVGVKIENKNEDEISVVKSLREDDTSDTMAIDVCNDDKEKEVGANDVQASVEKRKKEDQESGLHEPAKRVRRWNVGNNLIGDAAKASTTERELPAYSFAASGTVSASAAAIRDKPPSAMKPMLSRSDSINNVDSPKERVVPPSQKPPTNSLRIDRFLRPFTLKAVRELLAKTGTVTSFWMDHIKTHCYVTYSSIEEAIATRNALYNLQWPRNGGRQLIVEHVSPEEVKDKAEGPPEAPAPVHAPVATQPHSNSVMHNQMPFKPTGQGVAGPPQHALPPPPSLPLPPPSPLPAAARERQPLPPKKVEQPVHTLDDLFKKTRTSPRIYYLPLSEEEVAAKLAARARDRSS